MRIATWLSMALACAPPPTGIAELAQQRSVPLEEGPGQLRVMSLNVAHGGGLAAHPVLVHADDFSRNLSLAAELVRREQPHVVALQEVDAASPWTGNFDHLEYLGEHSAYPHTVMGIHVVLRFFGPKLRAGTALLGRVPFRDHSSPPFDTGDSSDLQGFSVASIDVPGVPDSETDVVSLHLSPSSHELRIAQIARLVATLEERSRPLVIMGDFNCEWNGDTGCVDHIAGALELTPYRPTASMPTYTSLDPRLRLDWILISSHFRFHSYRHLEDRVSDHRPVLADLRWQGSPALTRAAGHSPSE